MSLVLEDVVPSSNSGILLAFDDSLPTMLWMRTLVKSYKFIL